MSTTTGHADGGESPVATLSIDRLSDAITLAGLAGLSGRALLAYLATQRWFGGKGVAPTGARVVDVVPLPWDPGALGIAIVEVQASGGVTRYQLPVAVRRIDAAKVAATDPRAVIATVHAADGDATLLDALHDPVFQRQLGQAFVTPAEFASPTGGRWSIERISKAPLALQPHEKISVGGAEQSNSALIFGQIAILKIFRKLEAGIHPDVEMTRFLTVDAGFAHVPSLFGTISYHDKEGDSIAGMLQEYLPGSQTAWSYILDSAKSANVPAVATHDIEHLGRITRELHDSLAGTKAEQAKDFAPIRAGAGDVERWAQSTKEMIRETTMLLDRQRSAGKLSPERAVEADILVRRRDHYLSWIEEVADLIGDDGGAKVRIHGDYRLGQVLRTRSDSFVIIDFEGEPTRPIADRRVKTSALRDVAGMLRSLAYAAATLVQSDKSGSKKSSRTPAERELISGRWERDARAAFLRGYTGTMKDERNLLPRDPRHFDALLSLFEAERAFYELGYELNHRPGWEWIPMRGISKLLVAVAS